MKPNDKAPDQSRRKFLGASLLIGAGLLAPPVTVDGQGDAPPETIRLITADGQVMEVDKRRLPATGPKKPAGDEELKEWLDRKGG